MYVLLFACSRASALMSLCLITGRPCKGGKNKCSHMCALMCAPTSAWLRPDCIIPSTRAPTALHHTFCWTCSRACRPWLPLESHCHLCCMASRSEFSCFCGVWVLSGPHRLLLPRAVVRSLAALLATSSAVPRHPAALLNLDPLQHASL